MRRSTFFTAVTVALVLCSGTAVLLMSKKSLSRKKFQSTVSDNKAYPAFCHLAATEDREFKSFKRSAIFNLVHEQTTYEEGKEYLSAIHSQAPSFLDKITLLKSNDLVGNPRTFSYEGVGEVSPTTLRCIKVAADLKRLFGDLNGLKIVEIGGGEGGQCKILSDLFAFKSYTIVDLPSSLELAQRVLKLHGVPNVKLVSYKELAQIQECDLVISHYGFSESHKSVQKNYLDHLIAKSKMGYLVCNSVPKHFRVRPYPRAELLKKLKSKGIKAAATAEAPLMAKDNFVITWHQ